MRGLRDLDLVAAFVAVAEERHFRRAAERLHLTQPVVSRRIQRLEREVGVRLLERTTRQVTLTETGAAFLDPARRLLHDAGAAVDRLHRVAEGEVGRLTVGFVESVAFELLAPLLRELDRRVPDVTLQLRELTTEQQLTELHADIDVAIVRELGQRELEDEGLQARHLLRERLHLAIGADHRLADQKEVALAQLADEAFVLFPRHRVPRVHDHVLAVFDTAGFRPRSITHALQYTTMLAFVAAGRGAALVPGSVHAIRTEDIRLLPVSDPHATTDLSIAWHGSSSAALRAFLDAAGTVASQTARRYSDGCLR